MGFAVYHTEKGKGNATMIGHHIDRTPGKEFSYQHADKERLAKNVVYQVPNGLDRTPLNDAIKQRIEQGKTDGKKVRKDAVTHLRHIFTGTHEDMVKIFADEKTKKAWLNANFRFAIQEFGKENLVRAVVHLDEKTPHLHVVSVPITKDGRLSAKEIMGNRKAMQERQDRYAAAMAPFGLQRGIKNTGVKHERAAEYYKRINSAMEKDLHHNLPKDLASFKMKETPQIEGLPPMNPVKRKEWVENENKRLEKEFRAKESAIQDEMKKRAEKGLKELKEQNKLVMQREYGRKRIAEDKIRKLKKDLKKERNPELYRKENKERTRGRGLSM